jgi:hypothetical protein
MSNKSNNRRGRCHRCTHGESSYNNVLFYTLMMSRWIKTLSCPIYQEDMIWFRYTIRSDYNDKELWSANKSSWDTVYQTPKEKYISMLITENAAGGIKED